MELSLIDLLAVFAAIMGVWMCGITNLRSMLFGLAIQTALLGSIVWLHAQQVHFMQYFLLACIVIIVKAIAIPIFLAKVAERIEVRNDKSINLTPSFSLFAGCGALATGYLLTPQVAGIFTENPGAGGMALALLFIGMLQMLTRRSAISQIIGFLVLENGIFLYGLTQTHGMPIIVEMGVVFDVLVSVMIAGLVIFRLNRSFEHIDVTKLRGLKG